MRHHLLAKLALGALLCTTVSACQTAPQEKPDLLSTKPAVELRAMQTRAFDSSDRTKTLGTVVATLQDIGYTLDKVEPNSGTVSATKLDVLRLSALVYPRGTKQMVVRANAMVIMPSKNSQVDDPLFYQKLFFEPLSKAMFLSALQIEDDPNAPAVPMPKLEAKPNPANKATPTPAPNPAAPATPTKGN